MFKIFLSCSHKKTSPEGEWGDARRAGGWGARFLLGVGGVVGFCPCAVGTGGELGPPGRGPISLEK